MRYTNEYFIDVVIEVMSLLNRGLVVEISGKIVKPDSSAIEEYNTLFYARAQFDSYYNNLQERTDIEEWEFSGRVKIVETNIKFNKKRSQTGMGTNYLY